MTRRADNADLQAVQKVLNGNMHAFSKLVTRYQHDVYRYALSISGSREDAADATQETFLRLYRHLDQYNPRYPLRPYLMTIAANAARSIARGRKDHTLADDREDAASVVVDQSPDPGKAMWHSERRQAVRKGVGQLPSMLREACVLFYLNGLSCAETATILNTTEGAVKTALHRARKRLAQGHLREWLNPWK